LQGRTERDGPSEFVVAIGGIERESNQKVVLCITIFAEIWSKKSGSSSTVYFD
jgi:hypothetical protein